MIRLVTYKFRIEPNGKQIRDMRKIAGSCRFVYNKALALQISNREAGQKHVSAFDMNNWITAWKKEAHLTWLKKAPSQTLQQSLKDLDAAYQNFFAKRAAFPKYKSGRTCRVSLWGNSATRLFCEARTRRSGLEVIQEAVGIFQYEEEVNSTLSIFLFFKR